jgi:hypothetical protein
VQDNQNHHHAKHAKQELTTRYQVQLKHHHVLRAHKIRGAFKAHRNVTPQQQLHQTMEHHRIHYVCQVLSSHIHSHQAVMIAQQVDSHQDMEQQHVWNVQQDGIA